MKVNRTKFLHGQNSTFIRRKKEIILQTLTLNGTVRIIAVLTDLLPLSIKTT